MSTEVWISIPNWNHYEVSNIGRVRSIDRYLSNGTFRQSKILSPAIHNGYFAVKLQSNGIKKTYKVHLLVLSAFVSPRPNGLEARHLNGDSQDNRIENLSWGTKSENNMDRVKHGTHSFANKTHCPSGHSYSVENTYITPTGGRKCKICKRKQFLEFKERKKLNG